MPRTTCKQMTPSTPPNGLQRPLEVEARADPEQHFRELVRQANQGDRDALARLRSFLDQNPVVWQRAGDLTAVAEQAWIELVSGGDSLAIESLQRKVAQLKGEIRGSHPTPIEILLSDLVATSWLAVRHAEIQAASPAAGSLEQAGFRLRRAESAQKRLLQATKTLATLRALVPRGLVPHSPLHLHDPGQTG